MRKTIFGKLGILGLLLVILCLYSPGNVFSNDGWKSFVGNIVEAQETLNYKGISYVIGTDGNITITNLPGEDGGLLQVPETIDGHTVTAIGDSAYRNRSSESPGSLVLPDSIVSIGDYAFYNSGFWCEWDLPSNLKYIGKSAFEDNAFVGSLNIPKGVETIGEKAFYDATYEYWHTSASLCIPSTVTSIGNNAFWGMDVETVINHSSLEINLSQFIGDEGGSDIWHYTDSNVVIPSSNCYLGLGSATREVRHVALEEYTDKGVREIFVGYSFQPFLNTTPPVSQEKAHSLPITWSSSDQTVARISNNGTITGVSPGICTIYATYNKTNETSSFKLKVFSGFNTTTIGFNKWYLPKTMKVGDKLHDHTGYCNMIPIADIYVPSEQYVGWHVEYDVNGYSRDEFQNIFSDGSHLGGSIYEIVQTGYQPLKAFGITATMPGRYSIQCVLRKYEWHKDYNCLESVKIGEPFVFTIEEPIISINCPSTAKIGTTQTITSLLTNTSLEDEDLIFYKNVFANDPYNHSYCGNVIYEPSFEIIEGADCVSVSNTDFTHTLSASESLTFNKEGTVRIKVKYTHLKTCGLAKRYGTEEYWGVLDPEKIITINVKGNTTDKTSASSEQHDSVVKEPITITQTPAKLKAKAKKNKVTLSWKKIKKNKKGKKLLKQISGIQVQYSTDPGFPEGNTVTRSLGKKKTKVKLKLQRKSTYYIRVRYVGNGGYSNWSGVKVVKTK